MSDHRLKRELEALGLKATGVTVKHVEMWIYGQEIYWFGLPPDANEDERDEYIAWVKANLGIGYPRTPRAG